MVFFLLLLLIIIIIIFPTYIYIHTHIYIYIYISLWDIGIYSHHHSEDQTSPSVRPRSSDWPRIQRSSAVPSHGSSCGIPSWHRTRVVKNPVDGDDMWRNVALKRTEELRIIYIWFICVYMVYVYIWFMCIYIYIYTYIYIYPYGFNMHGIF